MSTLAKGRMNLRPCQFTPCFATARYVDADFCVHSADLQSSHWQLDEIYILFECSVTDNRYKVKYRSPNNSGMMVAYAVQDEMKCQANIIINENEIFGRKEIHYSVKKNKI